MKNVVCPWFLTILRRLVDYFYHVFTGKNPRPETVLKITNFIVFGAGMMMAKLLSIGVQILMGRAFGPDIYGQITIILLLASYVALPMVNGWGLAFVKIAAQTKKKELQLQALQSLLILVFIFCTLTVCLLVFIQEPLSHLIDITPEMMKSTIIVSVFYAWWILGKQIVQGFQDWNKYIAIENFTSCILLFGISGMVWKGITGLESIVYIFCAGYFFSTLILCKKIIPVFFVQFKRKYFQGILSHGSILLMNGLVGVATFSIDRLLINTSLGPKEVGIYQAHFLATYGIISAFMTILLTYVFPSFCRDKENTIHKAMADWNRLQYPATVIVSLIIGAIVLRLYTYPVSWPLLLTLCLFDAVYFHVQLKIWYIASKGAVESRTTLYAQCVFLMTNIIFLLFLISPLGIIAGGISLLAASLASLGYLLKMEEKIYARAV